MDLAPSSTLGRETLSSLRSITFFLPWIFSKGLGIPQQKGKIEHAIYTLLPF